MGGYAYERAAETAETAKDYLVQNQHAANTYKEAANLFKQIGNNAEEFECEAEISYVNGLISSSAIETKTLFSQSYELFIKSSDFFSKNEDQKSLAKTLSRAALISWYIVTYCSDQKEIEQHCKKCIKIGEKAWKLSKEVKNYQAMAESLMAMGWAQLGVPSWIGPYKLDKYWKEEVKKFNLLVNESLDLIESSEDSRALGCIYFTVSTFYGHLGVRFGEDEKEESELVEKSIKFSEKALIYAREIKDTHLIILIIFWLNYFCILKGKYKYIQKRIANDIKEMEELGKIYTGLNHLWYYYTMGLPAFYYSVIARRSFFSHAQRKIYSEKSIEYHNKSLKHLAFIPFAPMEYLGLTVAYSNLATFTTDKVDQEKYLDKMFQHAKEAEKFAVKYEGGMARAAGYNSLYNAYRTYTNITENKEEKIKMLSNAIDASEKSIEYSVETKLAILTYRLRLGQLYEELGILSNEKKPLIQARELFLHLIKETMELRYYFITAAAYESNARIETRLGNHITSAENYLNAQNAHREALKNIEYKPLKDLVKEKIDYSGAWNQIEKAKAHHKREKHLNAKMNYENASEILKNLPKYNYETAYYSAWALLEKAEHLSKEERQDDAIEQYKATKTKFNETIKILEKVSKRTKEKKERERLEKLEKVAKLRVNYCSARINLEKARILGKQGEHLEAAEKFASAASQFRDVCTAFKNERERRELEAIYYLCRAWETMEFAEKYENPERFLEASGLFTTASNFFTDTNLKLLASGNSVFCQALEYGCRFDESTEIELKAQLYPKVKSMLRKAASLYGKGGYENGADWALATSTYFDGTWNLIRADEELEFDEKGKLLGIGSRYLKSAAELFSKAGYKDKEKEIQNRLNRLEKEEKILVSALGTITKPTISRSTTGIVAPTCPLETSQTPRMSEIHQITEESRRVLGKRLEKSLRRKYEIVYRDLLKEYPRVQKRECRVAIAQIGVSKSGNIINEFYEMKVSGLLGFREDKIDMIRTKVKTMIENAAENGVNILIFPEMTIDLNYSELIKDISDLAKLYNMYIIPGSYHDQETKRNLSRVMGPDGILWEQEKHIPAIIHFGKKRFKEAIEVGPIPRNTIVCNTEYGRIAIVICRDFLDMDLRVELKNFEPPIDIIINPAFTPVTADFKATHFDARRSIYAYCFFANVGEFGDSLIYTPEKERIERTIPSKEEGIIYKDIDIFKLRSERKKWEKEQKNDVQFIQSTRT